ncbi:DUF397 domain-containing protein [Actinocorallia lasiicapitis]
MTALPVWRKSSYSTQGTSSECVEVAELSAGTVGLRDSKRPDHGNHTVTRRAFASLVRGVKRR